MNNEQQFAEKIVKILEDNVDSSTESVADRLAATRRSAIALMNARRYEPAPQLVVAGWGHLVEFSHQGGYRFWLPVLLLLAIMLATLGSISSRSNQPIDTDALLLASDLPPEAFADKEFVAWLENSSHL